MDVALTIVSNWNRGRTFTVTDCGSPLRNCYPRPRLAPRITTALGTVRVRPLSPLTEAGDAVFYLHDATLRELETARSLEFGLVRG